MKNIIAGPSHVVRMQHAVANRNLAINVNSLEFIGLGGAPTWNPILFNKVKSTYSLGDNVSLIVGDFRFGNSIMQDGIDIAEAEKNYINVHREFISPAEDTKMYAYFIRGLENWKSHFKYLNAIPWTLIMRRAENLSIGIHLDDKGFYQHPSYNEHDVISLYCDKSYLRCLSVPYRLLNAFYIDSDLHPSTLGYMFLSKCIEKHNPVSSVYFCIKKLEKNLRYFFKEMNIPKKVNIFGDSVSLATLKKVLPVELCLNDIIYFSDNPSAECINIKLNSLKSNVTDICELATDDMGIINFPWDYLGFRSISKRHPDLNRLNPIGISMDGIKQIGYYNKFDAESFFDIGEKLTPTLRGMLFILSLASDLSDEQRMGVISRTLTNIHMKNNSSIFIFKSWLKSIFSRYCL